MKNGPEVIDILRENLEEYGVSEVDLEETALQIQNFQTEPRNDVDTIDGLCHSSGVEIGPADGILLIQVAPSGVVVPTVLRLGLMTEGRIEAQMMPIFNAIVRARMRAAQGLRRTSPIEPMIEDESDE